RGQALEGNDTGRQGSAGAGCWPRLAGDSPHRHAVMCAGGGGVTARARILFVSLEDPFKPTGGSAIRTRSLLLGLSDIASVTLLVADGRGLRPTPPDDELARGLEGIRYLDFERRGLRKWLSQGFKLGWPPADLGLQRLGRTVRE